MLGGAGVLELSPRPGSPTPLTPSLAKDRTRCLCSALCHWSVQWAAQLKSESSHWLLCSLEIKPLEGQGGRSQGLDTVSLALPTAGQGCEDSRQGWGAGGPGLGADTWGDWIG